MGGPRHQILRIKIVEAARADRSAAAACTPLKTCDGRCRKQGNDSETQGTSAVDGA
jgi:hypothetical protein